MSILGSLLGGGSNRPEPSQTMQSNAGGLMSKFNPFNLVSGMFGRRKAGAADNYAKTSGGMRKGLKDSKKKDPKFVAKTSRGDMPVQKGESVSDIAARLYNLIKSNEEKKKKELQIEQNFAKSLANVKEKRNQELIKALTERPKGLKKETKQIKKESDKVEKQTKEAKKEAPKVKEPVKEVPKAKEPVKEAPKAEVPKPKAEVPKPKAEKAPAARPPKAAKPKAEPTAPPAPKPPTAIKVPPSVIAGATVGLAPILAQAESGDYNQLVYPKKGSGAPTKANLTSMTIKEVLDYQSKMISSGKYPSSAVGKYQIIKETLKQGIATLKIGMNEKFDEKIQDRLYYEYLTGVKRKYLNDYLSGKSDNLERAQIDMAMEFASFGVPRDIKANEFGKNSPKRDLKKGQSFYAGDGVNKASVTPEQSAKALKEEKELRLKKLQPETSKKGVGEKIEKSSIEYKDSKKQAAAGAPSIDINVNNNVVAANQQRQTMVQSKSDASRFTEGART